MRNPLFAILLALLLAACGAAPRTPQGLPAAAPTAAPVGSAGPVLARLPAGERTAGLLATAVGAPFELELGEQIVVGDSDIGLTFVAVDEDSRCPTGLSCIWQGRAVVSLELTIGDQEPQLFSLAIPGDLTPDAPELQTFGAYRLRMLDLAPYPAGPGGAPEPYVVTLVLEQ